MSDRLFKVKLLPCGVPRVVAAGTVLEAARLAGAEAALVERTGPLGDDEATPRLAPFVVSLADHAPATHFVGFRGEEYHSAVRIFGPPDFYHRVWDHRAQREIAINDTVVFAKYDPAYPSRFNYDDSNEPDDPAARERLA